MNDRREGAVGAALCLGCYHSLWQWSQRGGLFRDSAESLNAVLPPWIGSWRLWLTADAFTTVGCMWVLGMVALAGMFLMLTGRNQRLSLGLLAGAGLAKLWFYTLDFRFWSGFESAHLLLIGLFLAGRPRLAAVRAGVAAVFMASGLVQAVNTGVTPLAAAELVVPSLWWLLPWEWVATVPLAALLVWQGVQFGAEYVMVLLPATLGGRCERATWPSLGLVAAGFMLLLGSGLGHPQLALAPERPRVHGVFQVSSGGQDWTFQVLLAAVGPGEHRVAVTREEGKLLRERWPAEGPVLVQPRYFGEAELALSDPYLFRAYAQALMKQAEVEGVEVDLAVTGRAAQRFRFGNPPSPAGRSRGDR